MDLDKLWLVVLLPLCFCLEPEADDSSFSLLRLTSCMVAVSAAAGFTVVAAVTLGLTLRKTRCRCCRQSESLEFDGKNEGEYASLQQPGGDFYQTTSLVNQPHLGALGRKSKKAFLETEEETEDIYENLQNKINFL